MTILKSQHPEDDLIVSEQAIRETYDPLSRLMKIIVFFTKMSKKDYNDLHRMFYEKYGAIDDPDLSKLQSDRSNLGRVFKEKRLTWNKFEEVILKVLQFDLIRISVTVRSKHNKKVYIFHSDNLEAEEVITMSFTPPPDFVPPDPALLMAEKERALLSIDPIKERAKQELNEALNKTHQNY